MSYLYICLRRSRTCILVYVVLAYLFTSQPIELLRLSGMSFPMQTGYLDFFLLGPLGMAFGKGKFKVADFKLGRKLGRGNFGSVYQAVLEKVLNDTVQ